MAKIRVNELAKELNIKQHVLLEKILQMNIPSVRSHLSPLEDDIVTKIKAEFRGKDGENDPSQNKAMVIRKKRNRPRRAIPAEQKQAQVVEQKQEISESPKEQPVIESLPVSSEERKPEPVKDSPEKKAETFRGKNFVLIRENFRKKTDRLKDGETLTGIKSRSETKISGREGGKRKSRTRLLRSSSFRRLPKSRLLKKMQWQRSWKPRLKKRRLSSKSRKEPKDSSVRTGPERTERPERPERHGKRPPVVAETPPVPAPADKLDRKKKKWKKDKPVEEAAPVADKNFSKKKISFKRKEVVEGTDLYDGEQQRIRKARKASKNKQQVVQPPQHQKTLITTPKAIKRRVRIDDTIILSDLAKRMGIKANDMIVKLMGLGVMATVNQTIDFDTAVLVASEFGYEVEKANFEEENFLNIAGEEDAEKMIHRAPVVTIMGHVDHGKTSLLDVIRKTRVTEAEAGGITQHIGAYSVRTSKGQVTFLDTPGHEAFTAMRARGAKVTDIVVLVVAADDGVMPQTIEAINHSKAAGVPIIVAVNKIDKPGADLDRVVRQLSDQGLVPEDWGGSTIFAKVSAKQNVGIDELLEMILLQAEVLELKANPDRLSVGYVVEAKLDAGRGPVATVLIQQGTLKNGDPVVCGIHYGKIRAMYNDRGKITESAGPSIPVEILGLSGVPNAGDEMVAVADEKSAKQVSLHRLQKQRAKELAKTSRMSLERLFERMKQGEVKSLNLIIKADVQGSIEALADSLKKLSNQEVSINVVHSATGTITESDISLATVSDAIIIGFNVRPSAKVQMLATEEHVDIRYYNIIYNAIKDIEDAILGMMASKFEERVLGRAEVRKVFHVPKIGAIAGSYVTDGKIQRNQQARLLRDGVVLYEGKISSLKRLKDDAKEVASGYECGIGIENYNDIKEGDIIECFYMEEIRPGEMRSEK